MTKIILDRTKCIGCGSCAALCDKFFEMAEDGKSHLRGAMTNPGKEETEVKDAGCAREAAAACPMQCIEIRK